MVSVRIIETGKLALVFISESMAWDADGNSWARSEVIVLGATS